jgi:Tol biopolymer transport system component
LAYDEASVRVVHVVRGDGSEDVVLTDRSEQPAYLLGWTADGQEVFVWSERGESSSILAINARSHEARVVADLTFLEGYEGEGENSPLQVVPGPRLVSPDSQRILLPLRNELGNIELLGVLDFEDGSFRLLYEQTIVDFGMDWSPDGESVVVAARYLSPESTDVARLYILDMATGQFELVETPVFNEGGDSSPQWSPDGSLLAVRGWLQPYIKNLETGDVTLLRNGSLEYDAMLWSPRKNYSRDACDHS